MGTATARSAHAGGTQAAGPEAGWTWREAVNRTIRRRPRRPGAGGIGIAQHDGIGGRTAWGRGRVELRTRAERCHVVSQGPHRVHVLRRRAPRRANGTPRAANSRPTSRSRCRVKRPPQAEVAACATSTGLCSGRAGCRWPRRWCGDGGDVAEREQRVEPVRIGDRDPAIRRVGIPDAAGTITTCPPERGDATGLRCPATAAMTSGGRALASACKPRHCRSPEPRLTSRTGRPGRR